MTFHKNEDPQNFVKIMLLEECASEAIGLERETVWAFNLFAFHPCGLNKREEAK